MAHLRFNIRGMTGPACQQKIEQALAGLPGVYAAVVCLDQGYADVEFGEDRVLEDRIVARIREAGYEARLGG
ncbi:MAG: heavy-metal-associated domain-containing protein [Gemmatimonadales bacterium]